MSPCPHIISRDGADYCALAESTVATLRARLETTEAMLAAQNREHLYTLLANGDLMQERDELRARLEASEVELRRARVENNHNWQANDMAESAMRERDELRNAIKPFAPQHSGLCIAFTHPDRPITEESCQCSSSQKKLMRLLGLLPKGGAR